MKKAILVCEQCLSRNYSIKKTESNKNNRIIIKKYCKTCGKHTIHKESK